MGSNIKDLIILLNKASISKKKTLTLLENGHDVENLCLNKAQNYNYLIHDY